MTPTDVEPICNIPDVLTSLYTVRAKIRMRKLWTYETKLDWDNPIPEEYRREWMIIFNDLPEMEKIVVKRYTKQ